MIDHAIILAGGFGTRIRELFPNVPKPMIPFHGKPFLHWQMNLLADHGFRTFTLCVHYMADHIMAYFRDGADLGLTIHYSVEDRPLGTGGAARLAAYHLQKPVLLINGDTFYELNYREFARQHEVGAIKDKRLVSMALAYVDDVSQYGQVDVTETQQVRSFREKTALAPQAGLINGGAYVIEPAVWTFIPPAQSVSIERDTFPALLADHHVIQGYPSHTRFVDIGTPSGYVLAEKMLQGANK